MLKEMDGFARTASFDAVSRNSAKSPLEQFIGSADRVVANGNLTSAVRALQQVTSLHAMLRASAQRTKSSSASALLQAGLDHMQKATQMQLSTIGVYKHHSTRTRQVLKGWASKQRPRLLLELDKVWWRLRGGLDAYIEEAE